jgi:hypothetical protein
MVFGSKFRYPRRSSQQFFAILGISNIRIILIHPHPVAGYFDPKLRLKLFGDGHNIVNPPKWMALECFRHERSPVPYGLTQSHLNTEP